MESVDVPPRCAVLVVEDDDDVREGFQEVLELEGYRVTVAENGQRALDALPAIAQPVVIMLDLMMPVMNGPEFLLALRAGPYRDLPVLVVSAFAERAADLPAQGVLEKPVRPDLLFRALDRLATSENP